MYAYWAIKAKGAVNASCEHKIAFHCFESLTEYISISPIICERDTVFSKERKGVRKAGDFQVYSFKRLLVD